MTPRILALQLALCPAMLAGPFVDTPVAATDPRLINWATSAQVTRGPVEIAVKNSALAGFGTPADATGPADATPEDPLSVVSLGDGGSATLRFDPPFENIAGPDFAVFENGHLGGFLELAHVEVSSDGTRFFRFPSISLTQTGEQIGSFDVLDPGRIHNLAGKHRAGFGTPFDLEDLRQHEPLLDLDRITHVRVIDVVGTLDPAHASFDSEGRIINDPYPTPFFTGGFDLDAVGAFSRTASRFGAWSALREDADPLAYATGGGIESRVRDGQMELRFSRRTYRNDVSVGVEASEDLNTWQVLAVAEGGAPMLAALPAVSVVTSGGLFEQLAVSVPATGKARFFRLAVKPFGP
jgi:hypothetical protein